ncbi:MAG: GTPase HflX [Pseudomonadota bacterium]
MVEHGKERKSFNRAWVVHPFDSGDPSARLRAPTKLDEAVALARSIDLDIAHSEAISLRQVRPSTLLGSGKVGELEEALAEDSVDIVVVDGALSPVQQRNLERAWHTKVIDRTSLILEIFGARARSREGVLQVELAALTYQRSRLVRSWTHLERQRGGFGFVGGPGESQIELDRRRIDERITKLRGELEDVRRTRRLHRNARERVPYPIVALVGYTNAGKSTLFNYLTGAHVDAVDKLFATLDPTMRLLSLPSGRRCVLADTVGFISDLPTMLVAAFRATLEEVISADIILHVRDIADPDTDQHAIDVLGVLAELDIDETAYRSRAFEVWNKIDLLTGEARQAIDTSAQRREEVYPVSAITGGGLASLLKGLDAFIGASEQAVLVEMPVTAGDALAWLYRHGQVVGQTERSGNLCINAVLDAKHIGQFAEEFPSAKIDRKCSEMKASTRMH